MLWRVIVALYRRSRILPSLARILRSVFVRLSAWLAPVRPLHRLVVAFGFAACTLAVSIRLLCFVVAAIFRPLFIRFGAWLARVRTFARLVVAFGIAACTLAASTGLLCIAVASLPALLTALPPAPGVVLAAVTWPAVRQFRRFCCARVRRARCSVLRVAYLLGCRPVNPHGYAPPNFCAGINRCVQNAIALALLRSGSVHPETTDAIIGALPLLFGNSTPTRWPSPDESCGEASDNLALTAALCTSAHVTVCLLFATIDGGHCRVRGVDWLGCSASNSPHAPDAYVYLCLDTAHAYALDRCTGETLHALAEAALPVPHAFGGPPAPLRPHAPTPGPPPAPEPVVASPASRFSTTAPRSAAPRRSHLLRLNADDLKSTAEGMRIADLRDALRSFNVPLDTFSEKSELAAALRGIVSKHQKEARYFIPTSATEWEEVPNRSFRWIFALHALGTLQRMRLL